ncbi:MAG: hypothetical protein R3B06_00075 [Kofleriaceae bacterium]
MPSLSRTTSLLLALPLATLLACDVDQVETGRNGLIEFTPSACGRPGCDLSQGVAIGGAFTIQLRGTEGRSAAELTLGSTAPAVVDVLGQLQGSATPTFQLVANGQGRADLMVLDRAGFPIDYLSVDVEPIVDLVVDADAPGLARSRRAGGEQVLEAPTGGLLTLAVSGEAYGDELIGDVQFLVELDQAIAEAMHATSDVGRGKLVLDVPAGEHAVLINAPGGARQRIVIVGR